MAPTIPKVKRASAKGKAEHVLEQLRAHPDPVVRAAVDHACAVQLAGRPAALERWSVGDTPKGPARAAAVRQLVADAREPFAVVRQNIKTAGVIAGWLTQRVHELGLAASRTDTDPQLADALRDFATRKRSEEDVAAAALVSCGVKRKTARNWINDASRKGLDVAADDHALGRRAEVAHAPTEKRTRTGVSVGRRTRITL